MTDLELLSLLKALGSTHDVALSEMMLALEKLFAVHSSSREEIRRLRAKVNRLIRVENSEDAHGNYVAQPNAQPNDLILEEEI